jgi:hypothetical protein
MSNHVQRALQVYFLALKGWERAVRVTGVAPSYVEFEGALRDVLADAADRGELD